MSGSAARSAVRSVQSSAQRAGQKAVPRTGDTGVRARALRIVAPARNRARRAPFVGVVVALLSVGLVGLIIINTALQDQSFRLAELSRQSAALQVQQQQLERDAERRASPASLAEAALRLGMVPNANPVFLRPSDGAVIGVPRPAEAGTNVNGVQR